MPLVHISLRTGKPEAYRQAIFDGLYRAMRDALNVPEDDQFMTITEHDAANFRYRQCLRRCPERGCRLYPDHRVHHPHRGTEEGAVPANRGVAPRARASGRRMSS